MSGGDRIPCGTARRRQLVRTTIDAGTPRVNGIDWVEVSEDQRTLTVGFIHRLDAVPGAAALGRFNFRLDGGVRARPVLTVPAVIPGNAQTVALTVDQPGDFSIYTLRLVKGLADDEAPDGFDPALASVPVDFKAGCPSPFDCRAESEPAARAGAALAVDYLARDFVTFRKLMLDRLSVTTPSWTERNPADLGIMLVEALAQTADDLSYFQDAVATEAYLGTARMRASVRRHARLLDYRLGEGVNARAWVCIDPDAGTLDVPAGTRLETRADAHGAEIPFRTLHDLRATEARRSIAFHSWSGVGCCLPEGATTAHLRADGIVLAPGDLLLLRQIADAHTGTAERADPRLRHVVRITEVIERHDPLDQVDTLAVRWDPADALPFELPLIGDTEAGPATPLAIANANVVLCEQGVFQARARADRPLRRDTLRNRARLPGIRVAQAVRYDHGKAKRRPAADCWPRAEDAIACIALDDGNDGWEPLPDLLDAGPSGRFFAVEPEDSGTALRFGDGGRGRRPESLEDFAVRYIEAPPAGAVGAGAIARASALAGPAEIWNPLPAFGGARPEPLGVARLTAPQAFRINKRCVTPEDYAAMASRFPGVQRATAVRRWTGSWYSIFLIVDLLGGGDPDPAFSERLLAFLEPARMAGDDLAVLPPRRIPLDIELRVCVAAGYRAREVEAALKRALTRYFDPDNFSFGDPVWLSPVLAAAAAVPGVDHVAATRFQRWGRSAAGELGDGVLRVGAREIAVLASDANFPERGRFAFDMIGGI